MRCVVCNAPGSKYKCRYCRVFFCSSACAQRHDDISPYTGNEPEEEIRHVCSVMLKAKRLRSLPTAANAVHPTGSTEMEPNNALLYSGIVGGTESAVLNEREQLALYKSPSIRNQLRDSALQSMIQRILQNPSSQVSVAALESAMANDSVFRKFCDEVLDIIWAAKAEG